MTLRNQEVAQANSEEILKSIAESNEGCPHYQIKITLKTGQNGSIEIPNQDKKEMEVLQKRLYVKDASGKKTRFTNNTHIELPDQAKIYFDHKCVGEVENGKVNFRRSFTLPEARNIGVYNKPKTSHGKFHKACKHHHGHTHDHTHERNKRIDGHTHLAAAFPMKAAFENAMRLNKQVYIPALVILQVLKNSGVIHDEASAKEWIDFLGTNKVSPMSESFRQKKDYSGDLCAEDFAREIPGLSEAEKNACLADAKTDAKGKISGTANYVDLALLKEKLGADGWGQFCNGFDMPAGHPCDFTEHMEAVYNLRNWFAKDSTFLKAIMEIVYQEYENKGIDFAEMPFGSFKKQAELDRYVEVTREIDQERALQGKPPISIRPGLSIARLTPPPQFRQTLLSYIPLILQNPELASVSVLAHETNPTTEHLEAIKEFIQIVNQHRPGFTVEVHAGETAYYGQVNMSEAYHFAEKNPMTLIRAGHANYGDHTLTARDNFIEEKCPLSNATLIDVEPEVHVNVLLGIVEGKSKIFWGSDGTIYNPEYGPNKQQEVYTSVIGYKAVQDELKRRWDNGEINDTFNTRHFTEYLAKLPEKLAEKLKSNEDNENKYITFKQHEKEFQYLKLNQARLSVLFKDAPQEILQEINKLLASVNTVIQQSPNNAAYMAFQNELASKHEQIIALNKKAGVIIESALAKNKDVSPEQKKKMYADLNAEAYKEMHPAKLAQREAVEFYNRLIKLRNIYPEDAAPAEVTRVFEKLTGYLPNNLSESLHSSRKNLAIKITDTEAANLVKAIAELNPKDKAEVNGLMIKNAAQLKNGDINCELYLNHMYHHDRYANRNQNTNTEMLKRNASTDNVPTGASILFGSPEISTSNNAADQQRYLANLYKNLYVALDNAMKNPDSGTVLLLGSVNEGINPLVYKVLNDHEEHFKDLKVMHVVCKDESYHSIQTDAAIMGNRAQQYPNSIVPYHVVDKSRQEAHVGYSDYIEKSPVKNVMMFGGEAALWSDTKVVLEGRLEKSGRNIQFYADGFGNTRSSSEYAKGAERRQRFDYKNEFPQELIDKNGEGIGVARYLDKLPKTMAYHRNLELAYKSLSELMKKEKIPFDITLNQFLSVYDPVISSNQELGVNSAVRNPANDQAAVQAGFKSIFENLQKEGRRSDINRVSMKIQKILGNEGYGVLNRMTKVFPKLQLQNMLKLMATYKMEVPATKIK